MPTDIHGLHHVTAICGDPQTNVDFYAGVLGLKLVKKTVNFDDPTTYHLYYGDEAGRPGTILTFFAWPGAPRGRTGTGQVTAVSFRIPPGALPYWEERLAEHAVEAGEATERAGLRALPLADPDGLSLELVESPELAESLEPSGPPELEPGSGVGRRERVVPQKGGVPAEGALAGFHGVTLSEAELDPTAGLLVEPMGFGLAGQEGDRSWFEARALEPGAPGATVDLLRRTDVGRGRVAVGTVHHVAFRTSNEDTQSAARGVLIAEGYEVTPIIDRRYFRSIYFREPGGVLFEVATDPPGFGIDEEGAVASELRLPPWLEERREELERTLPPVGPPRPTRLAS